MKGITEGLGRLLDQRRKKNRGPTLGSRELEVMKILWGEGELSAQQVLERLTDESLSLSTMQSTLERLHRKELVRRQKSGRFYIYQATVTRETIISQLLGDIAQQISDGDMAPMISGFMSFVDQERPESIPPEMRDAIQKLPSDSDE